MDHVPETLLRCLSDLSEVNLGLNRVATLTYIHRCVVRLDVLIEVGHPERVQRGCAHPVKKLSQHEDKAVRRESSFLHTSLRVIGWAKSHVLWNSNLIGWCGEVGQSKDQRPQCHDQHAPAKPSRLMACTAEVAHERQAQTSGDVVGACDESCLEWQHKCITKELLKNIHGWLLFFIDWPGSCAGRSVFRLRWWQCWWSRWWSCPEGRMPHRGRTEPSGGCWMFGYTGEWALPSRIDSQCPWGRTAPQGATLRDWSQVCLTCWSPQWHLHMGYLDRSPGTPRG